MPSSTPLATEMFTEDYFEHVHEYLSGLRADEPVHRATLPSGLPIWVVTRYDDVKAALTDERLAKDAFRGRELMEAKLAEAGAPVELPSTITSRHMLMADPPDHTRLRGLLARDFTSRRIDRLEPAVQGITDDLLDALADRSGPVDLVTGFAQALPSIVISELLGVPAGDRDLFQDLTTTLMEGKVGTAVSAATALTDYFADLIRAKAEQPGDDLLSALLKASADGDRLTDGELRATAVLLVIAGHETTGNLLGNSLHRLLTDRGLADRLRTSPEDLPPVLEELLRVESPVMLATRRFTTAPVRIGEVTIPAGETVFLSVGSGNRDERRFDRPDELDTERGSRGHLAFGHGLHYCLGAPLARLEGRIALGTFLRRFPDAALAVPSADLRRRQGVIMHGYTELPVVLAP